MNGKITINLTIPVFILNVILLYGKHLNSQICCYFFTNSIYKIYRYLKKIKRYYKVKMLSFPKGRCLIQALYILTSRMRIVGPCIALTAKSLRYLKWHSVMIPVTDPSNKLKNKFLFF